MSNELLKTPQEFINEESSNLKDYLKEHSDVQINKLGIIGFFINLLGNIRYDSTQYYQNLFMESSVITASDDNNLYMHSSVFGYTPILSTPSEAEGYFIFDFANLPISTSSQRTVTVKNINFEINDIQFKTNVDYKFIQENSSYYAIAYFEDGTTKYIPASSSSIQVPFYNVYQQIEETEILEIPAYDVFSFYTHQLDISPYYLSDLNIYIKESGETYTPGSLGDLYDLKLVKYLSNSLSEHYFLNILSTNLFNIEFGSGINGKHIPNSTATIKKTLTLGTEGHLNNDITINVSPTTTITLKDGDSSTTKSNRFVNVNFLYSHSGSNPNTEEDLRKDIIKYIQSRTFLINKNDYENLTNTDDNKFVYSFKKSSIQRNDFYLYQILSDSLQLPIKSTCYNVSNIDTTQSITGLNLSDISETDGTLAGSYSYAVFACNNFQISTITNSSITISTDNNAVSLYWDEFLLALYYIIVVDDGVDQRFFKTSSASFIDTGQDSNCINNFYMAENDNFSWEESYIFYPEFTIFGLEFISPFVYKYNSFMDWFDGYIFNNDFTLLFSRNTKTIDDEYTVPNFQLNATYDYYNKWTKLSVISTQDCSDYFIKLSISKTNIKNVQINISGDNNYYYYYYDTKSTNGLFVTEHFIEIDIYDITDSTTILATFKTDNFKQLLPLSDELKLLNYIDETGTNNIIDVPVMEKSIYSANQEYYNNKLFNILNQTQVNTNKFPTDEVQHRFLNTYYIEDIYLRNMTVQEYNYNLIMPLKLNITITYDSNYLNNNTVDLVTEKDNLYLDIVNKLQNEYTGCSIKFYNSHIIDFIHAKAYIKTLTVELVDSNDTVIASGLETYDNDVILENIQDDSYESDEDNTKLNIIKYTPHYFWWDVDNISITYDY